MTEWAGPLHAFVTSHIWQWRLYWLYSRASGSLFWRIRQVNKYADTRGPLKTCASKWKTKEGQNAGTENTWVEIRGGKCGAGKCGNKKEVELAWGDHKGEKCRSTSYGKPKLFFWVCQTLYCYATSYSQGRRHRVDMSTPLLPEVVPENDANLVSFSGQKRSGLELDSPVAFVH